MKKYYEAYDLRYRQVHGAGLEWFSGTPTPIVAEALAKCGVPADAPMLDNPRLNASWLVGWHVTAPEATRTVCEGDVLTYAGVTFTVLHTPGHTPGSVCYRAGEKLFTGDTLFEYGYGRTDLPGGSMAQLAESLRRLQMVARECEIYPGH